MSARHLSPRAIRRALDLLLQLPAEAQAELAERLIERVDAAGADPDAEPDDDGEYDQDAACDCGDDDPKASRPEYCGQSWGPGDPADGEPGEDAEPGPEDMPRHFRPEVVDMESWTVVELA